ncbi:MAG: MFS transporter, partial [Clostridium sp.]
MENINVEKLENKKNKLWAKNFTLLWLGQFVSSLGDSFYSMALSVFILDTTGSIAYLGFVNAVSLIPRIIISPFAGSVADTHDRKKIIILSDLISGISLVLLFLAINLGYKPLWIFLVVGIIIGIAGCFFGPAVNSAIPDVVDKDNLVKANSSLSIVYEGTNILGSASAGVVISLIGAPLLFLFNGISFILSATSESFITIPSKIKKVKKINYFKDIISGAKYVIGNKGLVFLYIIVSFLNFFGSIGFMLVLPYFKMTNGLGIGSYGIALSFSSVGLIMGFTILSKVDFKKVNKFALFIMSGLLTSIA